MSSGRGSTDRGARRCRYRAIVTPTFVPAGLRLPGFTVCLITVPRGRRERDFLTLPSLQCAFLSSNFAFASVLPLRFGTTQRGLAPPVLGLVATGASAGPQSGLVAPGIVVP